MNTKTLALAIGGLALGAALMSEANVASATSGDGVNAGQAPREYSEFASPYTLRLRARISILGATSKNDVLASTSGWYDSALYWSCPGVPEQAAGSGARYNTITLGDLTRVCAFGLNATHAAGLLSDQNGQPTF